MSECKPGTILTDEIGTIFFVVAVSENGRQAWGPGVHAVDADGNGWRVDTIESAHPLVVIDPEDREQVERLIECWAGETGSGVLRMQNSLREFANPRIPEPTGLGAVVEDAEGERWVRSSCYVTSHRNDWHRDGGTSTGTDRRHYDGIDAARVLSEGVQP